MTDGSQFGSAAVNGILNDNLFSWLVTWFWYLGWVCTRSSLAVHRLVLLFVARGRSPLALKFFCASGRSLCFFGNELLQIEYLRGVFIETFADDYAWIMFWDSFPLIPRFQQNVIWPNLSSSHPRLDQCAHNHRKQSGLLRGCVCSVHLPSLSVLAFANFC